MWGGDTCSWQLWSHCNTASGWAFCSPSILLNGILPGTAALASASSKNGEGGTVTSFQCIKIIPSYKCSATTRWIHEWNDISVSRAVFLGKYHSAWGVLRQAASFLDKPLPPGLLTLGTLHGLHSRADLHNLDFKERVKPYLKNLRLCYGLETTQEEKNLGAVSE